MLKLSENRKCKSCHYDLLYQKANLGDEVISRFIAVVRSGEAKGFLEETSTCPGCTRPLLLRSTLLADPLWPRPAAEEFQLFEVDCSLPAASADTADEPDYDRLLPAPIVLPPNTSAPQLRERQRPVPFWETPPPPPPDTLWQKLRRLIVKVSRRIWYGKNDPNSENRRNWGSRS